MASGRCGDAAAAWTAPGACASRRAMYAIAPITAVAAVPMEIASNVARTNDVPPAPRRVPWRRAGRGDDGRLAAVQPGDRVPSSDRGTEGESVATWVLLPLAAQSSRSRRAPSPLVDTATAGGAVRVARICDGGASGRGPPMCPASTFAVESIRNRAGDVGGDMRGRCEPSSRCATTVADGAADTLSWRALARATGWRVTEGAAAGDAAISSRSMGRVSTKSGASSPAWPSDGLVDSRLLTSSSSMHIHRLRDADEHSCTSLRAEAQWSPKRAHEGASTSRDCECRERVNARGAVAMTAA
jgi:hypothetical protein